MKQKRYKIRTDYGTFCVCDLTDIEDHQIAIGVTLLNTVYSTKIEADYAKYVLRYEKSNNIKDFKRANDLINLFPEYFL